MPGLETLDLSGNGLGEIGAQRILEHAARFAHLRSFVFRLNGIAHEDVRRIRAALPRVDALGQVSPERFDDDRYDSIHE